VRCQVPVKMEQTQCSETSAVKHHTLENNPKGYTRIILHILFADDQAIIAEIESGLQQA
jgi:hypothetical protein